MTRLLLLISLSIPVRLLAQDPAAFSPLYGAITSSENYRPLTTRERLRLHWRQSYANPMAPIRTLVTASADQLNNEPKEWGQTAGGFARRAGDRFARFTSQDSMEALGSGLLGHEVRYISCAKCKGFGSRFWNAARQNFVTFDRNGHWVPAYARIGATVAAEYLPPLWRPAGQFKASQAVSGVATQMAFGTATNLIREFAPEIRRILRRKK